MQDPASQVLDSAGLLPDTAASPDTLVVVPDSTTFLQMFSNQLDSTTSLIQQGRFRDAGSQLAAEFIRYVPVVLEAVLKALIILLLAYAFYRVVGGVLQGVLKRSRRLSNTMKELLQRAFNLVVLTFATLMTLDQLGLQVTTLLAGIGIAGIALSFAARDTLENLISGVTIALDQPFEIGDNIEVADTFGTVVEITLRSTRIRTLNNEIAIIPNLQMINQKLINHTKQGMLRIVIPFGIAYKEYPQQAREAVLALTKNDPRLHPDQPATVVVTSMNASSVDMELRVWAQNPKLEIEIRLDYTEKIREALRAADIEIPFPHLQLFIDEAKAFQQAPLFPPDAPSSN